MKRRGDGASLMKRRGVTLVELVVVLAILGAVAAVSAPAFPRRVSTEQGVLRDTIAALRAEAAERGRPATRVVAVDGIPRVVTAWPTGLVMVDSARRSRVVLGEDVDVDR